MGKLVKLIGILCGMGCLFTPSIIVFAQPVYHASLQMNDRLSIPFEATYAEENSPALTIINGQEKINLRFLKSQNDTIYMEFPEIAGLITFHKNSHIGYWTNLNKTTPTKYPFSFYPVGAGNDVRFDTKLDSIPLKFEGTYDVTFTDQSGESSAIGMFSQQENSVVGTFRTETGDYRYLAGGVFNGTLKLSCFDGVHAYLFEARQQKNQHGDTLLAGSFYAGSKYSATWIGKKNLEASLAPSNALSWPLVPLDLLNITVMNIKGKNKKLSTDFFKGSPTVVQLMGTWCPNCLDESKYFIELSKNKNFIGVRFVGVAFENGTSTHDKLSRLKRYKKKIGINYPLYLGGGASTKEAHAVFNQLNGVFAFPTTLFLDDSGRIIEVHAGFDGPATGEHYEVMKQETELLLQKLLHPIE